MKGKKVFTRSEANAIIALIPPKTKSGFSKAERYSQ